MAEYEVLVETINPCGGDHHATQEILEVEAESPAAYVAQKGRYPVLTMGEDAKGDMIITTGDGKGYVVRYTFMG